MTPRIPLIRSAEAVPTAESVGVEEALARLNIFGALLHQPELSKWVRDLLMGLLGQSSLDARLRELIIMRLGWATESVYEWTQHWGIATEWLDVDPDDLVAVRQWRSSDRFGAAERAVLAATDDVVADGHVSAASFEACRASVSSDPAQLVELVTTIAMWRLVSTVLQSLDIPIEDHLQPWPPDGRAPGDPETNAGVST